ncbi:hypothetical protein CN934_19590 [Ensifer sp. MMN_5]|nr:hypothetical protein CN934_19590 [Ensifer sp. MMN_5]PND27957.1 hypothetical protein CN933_07550 [Sinorhizobium sp. M4_45]
MLVTGIQQRRVCGAGNEEIKQAAAGGANFNRPWRNSTKVPTPFRFAGHAGRRSAAHPACGGTSS